MHGVEYRKLYSFITHSKRCDSAGITIHLCTQLDAFLKVPKVASSPELTVFISVHYR